ncbi:MAG: hypothetical protein ACQUHE_02875 [Bacteroidia bacterium]
MRVTCENDHVRNLANFDSLIAIIVGFGKHYKPTKGGIQLEALKVVSQNAKVAIANVNQLTDQHIHAVNLREVAFTTLQLLNEKLANALQVTANMSEIEMYMLVGSKRVLYNQFASQSRYDFLLDNFCKVIKMIKSNPLYLPQDPELQILKLEEFYAILYFKNNEVKKVNAWLANACLIRDEVIYREHNGLVTLSAKVRTYVKYHFGWDSMQFKKVAMLDIKKGR